MNSIREFEGKDVNQAIEIACSKLNIQKNELKYDVISTGSSGIFSILSRKKAKIRVKLNRTNPTKKAAGISNLVDEAFGVNKPKKSDTRKNFKQNNLNPKTEKPPKSVEPDVKVNSVIENNNLEQENKPPKNYDYKSVDVNTIISESDLYKGKSAVEIGVDVIKNIVNLITTETDITYTTEYDNITYQINGGNSAVLIGKRGQTLESIQYLVDKVVNKHCQQRVRIQIDVEGYLETRKENLEKLAKKMSEKAKKTGKPSTISQMSAHDRRIVHLALKDDRTVRTQSMGEGYYRRLVIFPKNRRGIKKK
jgi:spoIIIJ-associated protein